MMSMTKIGRRAAVLLLLLLAGCGGENAAMSPGGSSGGSFVLTLEPDTPANAQKIAASLPLIQSRLDAANILGLVVAGVERQPATVRLERYPSADEQRDLVVLLGTGRVDGLRDTGRRYFKVGEKVNRVAHDTPFAFFASSDVLTNSVQLIADGTISFRLNEQATARAAQYQSSVEDKASAVVALLVEDEVVANLKLRDVVQNESFRLKLDASTVPSSRVVYALLKSGPLPSFTNFKFKLPNLAVSRWLRHAARQLSSRADLYLAGTL